VISRLRYTLREMWASLTRNLTLTVAAVITSMVSLFLFGITLLIQQAFDNQLSQWTGGVQMVVYVNHGAQPEAVATIKEALESRPELIKNVDYCPVDCSLAQAKKLFAADPESLKFLSADNVPSYFSVEPVNKDQIQQLLSIRDSFTSLPGVFKVAFPSDQIEVLGKLKSFFGVRTYVMSGVLLFASILLIWNTIRTAMFARRREIEVMKLVGATNWFVRVPFILEGMLTGILGALGGVLVLAAVYTALKRINSGLAEPANLFPGGVIALAFALAAFGAVLGAFGSGMTLRRFLKV